MKNFGSRKKYSKQNTNYYEIAGDTASFARKNAICRTFAVCAAVTEIAAIFVYAFAKLRAYSVVAAYYEAALLYVGLYILAAVALVWTAVWSFFGYTLRREVPERRSPFLGFRVGTYLGIFLAAFLTLALAVYHTVLTAIGAHGNPADITVCILLLLSAALATAHYVIGYTTNRDCVLVITEEAEKAKKENRTAKPLFHLTEEEIEQSKNEFAPGEEKPKKKKRVAYKRKDGSIDYGDDETDDSDRKSS